MCSVLYLSKTRKDTLYKCGIIMFHIYFIFIFLVFLFTSVVIAANTAAYKLDWFDLYNMIAVINSFVI